MAFLGTWGYLTIVVAQKKTMILCYVLWDLFGSPIVEVDVTLIQVDEFEFESQCHSNLLFRTISVILNCDFSKIKYYHSTDRSKK